MYILYIYCINCYPMDIYAWIYIYAFLIIYNNYCIINNMYYTIYNIIVHCAIQLSIVYSASGWWLLDGMSGIGWFWRM